MQYARSHTLLANILWIRIKAGRKNAVKIYQFFQRKLTDLGEFANRSRPWFAVLVCQRSEVFLEKFLVCDRFHGSHQMPWTFERPPKYSLSPWKIYFKEPIPDFSAKVGYFSSKNRRVDCQIFSNWWVLCMKRWSDFSYNFFFSLFQLKVIQLNMYEMEYAIRLLELDKHFPNLINAMCATSWRWHWVIGGEYLARAMQMVTLARFSRRRRRFRHVQRTQYAYTVNVADNKNILFFFLFSFLVLVLHPLKQMRKAPVNQDPETWSFYIFISAPCMSRRWQTCRVIDAFA